MGNKYLGNISQRLSLFKIDSLVYKNSLKLTYWKYFENIIDVNLEMTFEKMTFTKFQIKFSKTIHIQSLKTVCKQDVNYIWVRLDWIEAVQLGSRKKFGVFRCLKFEIKLHQRKWRAFISAYTTILWVLAETTGSTYFWSLTKSHFEWSFITVIQNLNHENKFWSDWSNWVIITTGGKGLVVGSGAIVVSSQQ